MFVVGRTASLDSGFRHPILTGFTFFNQRLMFAYAPKTYRQNNLILLNPTCYHTLLANQEWHLDAILSKDRLIESLAPLELLVVVLTRP